MSTPKKVTFRFETDNDYRIIPVNGVWGGPTSRGDVKVDLFHESQSLPTEVAHSLSPDGRMGEESDRRPQSKFKRTVLVGLVLTADQADSIGRWLQDQARQVRDLQEKGGNGEPNTVTTH